MRTMLGIACLSLAACVASGERDGALELYRYEAPAMGTLFRCSLHAPDEEQAAAAWEAAIARIVELEKVASDYDAESELRRLCSRPAGEWTPISRDLTRLLERSKEISELTGGAFDPTVGPYVRLWRRARRTGELPDAERIEAVASSVGMHLVELGEGRARLLADGMRLDLGAIAKGDALDEAMRILRERGMERALLDGGGDLVIGAPPPGRGGWKVALRPYGTRGPVWALELSDAAVATSGDVSSFGSGGVSHSHIIDPRTGWALRGSPAATVLAPDGATADALASAMCVMGEKGIELLNTLPHTEGSVWDGGIEDIGACATPGLRRMMVELSAEGATSPLTEQIEARAHR